MHVKFTVLGHKFTKNGDLIVGHRTVSLIPNLATTLLMAYLQSFHLFRELTSSSVGKESACNAGDPGSIPGWGRSPGKGNGYPL